MNNQTLILAIMKRVKGPVSASHIARLARLPLYEVIDALNRLMENGLVVRVMASWGRILYELKERE